MRRGLLAGVALVAALSILACAGSTRPSNKPCDPAHLCPTPSPTLAPNPSATPTPASSPGPSGSTTYTFDDEFNGTALSSAWSGDRPSIGGQEASFGLSQATVANGLLTISAIRSGSGWSSGLVSSALSFSQEYGYFESRIKVPKGTGMWPAFWLLGLQSTTQGSDELDTMEICANQLGANLGNDASLLHTTLHLSGGSGAKGTRAVDLSADFHVYALDWRAHHVAFFLDNVEVWRFTDTAHIPAVAMSVILDLAVGGSWCGASDAATPDPSRMQVDYIRVSP